MSVSGTGDTGDKVTLTVTDVHSAKVTAAPVIVVDGKWSVTGIDVSGLADGTITFSVVETDPHGTPSASVAVLKYTNLSSGGTGGGGGPPTFYWQLESKSPVVDP